MPHHDGKSPIFSQTRCWLSTPLYPIHPSFKLYYSWLYPNYIYILSQILEEKISFAIASFAIHFQSDEFSRNAPGDIT